MLVEAGSSDDRLLALTGFGSLEGTHRFLAVLLADLGRFFLCFQCSLLGIGELSTSKDHVFGAIRRFIDVHVVVPHVSNGQE